MEPPPELLMDLLPFQKEFLAWAVAHEQSEIRGGILADEMGMGKTIQVCCVFFFFFRNSFLFVVFFC